jgi:hypothetical protein
VSNIYKNKHEMIMIAKTFETYVSSGNLGLSLRKVHCSLRKLPFSQRRDMSPRRRNLSCLGEQLKPFFPPKNKEQSCSWGKGAFFPSKTWLFLEDLSFIFSGTWLFPREQLKPFFFF